MGGIAHTEPLLSLSGKGPVNDVCSSGGSTLCLGSRSQLRSPSHKSHVQLDSEAQLTH